MVLSGGHERTRQIQTRHDENHASPKIRLHPSNLTRTSWPIQTFYGGRIQKQPERDVLCSFRAMLLSSTTTAARAQVSIPGVGRDDKRRSAYDERCIREGSGARQSAREDTNDTNGEEPQAPLVPMDSPIPRQQSEHADRQAAGEEEPLNPLIAEPCHSRGGQASGG